MSSRNTDIQEEYQRMLKELEDQTESLTKVIKIHTSTLEALWRYNN